MNTNIQSYKYFKPEEFAKCIPACRINDLNPYLLELLDRARDIAGIPFVINSAFRTKEYEIKKCRTGLSSHCKGLAVDIKCNDSIDRFLIIKSLIDVGFTRLGIYETFIHADIDVSKPDCIWYGK